MSIDGGGVKGLITAEVIKILEKHRPGFINKFECFTGSSSGAIMSALYAAEHSPDKAFDIFKNNMDFIFSIHWKKRLKTMNGILSPLYEKENLQKVCSNITQDLTLNELQKDLLIWSYDLVNQQPYLYMNCSNLNKNYTKMKYSFPTQYIGYLDNAVYSSCLAPTYFTSDSGLTDGGIFANNPATISFTTLFKQDKNLLDNSCMLSIGYNDSPDKLKVDGGTITWLQAARTLMHTNMTQGKYNLENILGNKFFRIEINTKVGMDSIKEKDKLIADAHKYMDENLEIILVWVDKYIMN